MLPPQICGGFDPNLRTFADTSPHSILLSSLFSPLVSALSCLFKMNRVGDAVRPASQRRPGRNPFAAFAASTCAPEKSSPVGSGLAKIQHRAVKLEYFPAFVGSCVICPITLQEPNFRSAVECPIWLEISRNWLYVRREVCLKRLVCILQCTLIQINVL